nr:putative disease resistance protein rga3 [Ipomoea batatas]
MAEAVISALLEVLFEKIASLVSKEYGGPLGTTRKEMEKLQSVLSTIKAVLQDAEERQLRDNALKNWLLKLKDIFYDADDLVDEYLTELLRNQVISISHHWDSCCCVLQAANSLIFNTNLLYLCYKMKLNLKEIGDRLELVANERLKFHLRDAVVYQSEPFRVESDSYLLESKVFGRDGDERNIVKLLTEPQGRKGVSVISIVGIAGIGKTTVAKLAYHNPEIERYFDRRIWVCVAEGFNVKRLMKAIVESDTGSESPKALRALKNAKKLRSFLLLNGWRKLSMATKSFFLSLKSVRALDFSGTRVKKISKSIATLLHLRYLNLSNTMLKTLPDSVCGLLNLETLILNRCIRLVELPEDMRNLVNLKHLDIYGCEQLTKLPRGIGKMKSLQTLPIYIVRKEAANDISELQSLDIGGELMIKNLENLAHETYAKNANLKEKRNLLFLQLEDSAMLCNLKKLTCFACPNLKCLPNLPSVDSLELHVFSSKLLEVVATKIATLSHLIISECPELECLPQGLLKNNKHLSSVEIQSCPKLQSLSSEPKGCSCSSLQSLSISNCGNLSSLRDSCGLQSLKSLSIRGCPSLSLETEMKGLNSLQFLSLSDCEELTTLPVVVQPLKSLQTLHLWSCPKLNALPDWIADLSSLREFELWYCENLHSFPDSMKSLTQLRFLSIWGSPLLEVRCRKGEGEDWYKIQHVPFIKINGPYIQAMTGECSIL